MQVNASLCLQVGEGRDLAVVLKETESNLLEALNPFAQESFRVMQYSTVHVYS